MPQLITSITQLIHQQKIFFQSHKTYPIDFRIEQLKFLQNAIIQYEDQIIKAVKADMSRPEFEAYFEISTLAEIKKAIKKLKSWAKPEKVVTGFNLFPSLAWIEREPLGIILIIGSWNYPFQLLFSPLIGSIAAGNCTILKPSELAPNTSNVVAAMIKDTFDPSYISVIEGGVELTQQLLSKKFDHIFFTGGIRIGKIVMKAAAEQLTPVTLELGGKSPCIVDININLMAVAKRIVWGKFINAGQSCVAPDYLLVHHQVKSQFVKCLQQAIHDFYGEEPFQSPDLGRIINKKHFLRLLKYLDSGRIVTGGKSDQKSLYIAPTILDQVNWEDSIMEEEIFGPILPILEYVDLDEAISQINVRPKPLALYFFSQCKMKQAKVIKSTSSGSVCLNDTVIQIAAWNLPFGGVGDSGIGSYHGRTTFETFSHRKSIVKRFFFLENLLTAQRYPPYGNKIQLIKKIILR